MRKRFPSRRLSVKHPVMNHHKRIIGYFCLVILLLILSLEHADAEQITIPITPGTLSTTTGVSGSTRLSLEGYHMSELPGNPAIPSKVLNLLVPPDIEWDSLDLSLTDIQTIEIDGKFHIAPAAPDRSGTGSSPVLSWAGNSHIADGKNQDVYSTDAAFPSAFAEKLPYSQMRKWAFARIRVYPVQYHPVSGKILRLEQMTLILTFDRTGDKPSGPILNDKVMDGIAPEMFDNFNEAKAWYTSSGTDAAGTPDYHVRVPESGNFIDPPGAAETFDYVIITTSTIVSGSTRLASFISHKQSRGHSVLVITESDFDGLTGQAPNHRAEKIRQWLINNYLGYQIRYVLLIGDPTPYESAGVNEDIPMKMCWPRSGESIYEESPTDGFYADLTGDWDRDDDQLFGEWSDYDAFGGVDFAMEVWVGRIPVYSGDTATLDSILDKIIAYEIQNDVHWREHALLPMSFSKLSYDGAPLAEQMKHDFLNSRKYSSYTQYQQGGSSCSTLPPADSIYESNEELRGGTVVRDRWASGNFGLVLWWGHGSQTTAVVGPDECFDGTLFDSSQAGSLNDMQPAFTFQCSCNNAYPENAGNLAYAILKQGGIGTVSATRVSWFNTGVGYGDFDGSSTNSGMGYEFADRLTQNQPAGQALYTAKFSTLNNTIYNTRLMNHYDFNLYGDPSTYINVPRAFSVGHCSPRIESLNDGSAYNWINDGSGTWSVTGGVYRMTGTQPQISTTRFSYYNAPQTDFIYEARVRKTQGNGNASMGLYFRSSNGTENQNAYVFNIHSNGSFMFYKYVAGVYYMITDWTSNPAILSGLGLWNTLRVEAQGSTFNLYCNDTLLGTYTDTSLATGAVGVKAYDTAGETDTVEFDDIRIKCGDPMPWMNLLLD